MLEKQGTQVYEVVLPDGEEYKNMDELMKILNACMEARLDRKSTLIALGGGVIGDMTGFAAAIYQRGIKFHSDPNQFDGHGRLLCWRKDCSEPSIGKEHDRGVLST